MQKGGINEIFDEIDFDKIERDSEKKSKADKHKLSKNSARILGAAVLLALLAAIIGSVFGVNTYLGYKAEQEKRYGELEEIITPVTATGVYEFSSAAEIDKTVMLRSCALYALKSGGSELKQNSQGATVLPVYMLNTAAHELYGDDVSITYFSFDISGTLFEYNSQSKCYCFFASGINDSYLPKVTSFTQSGDILSVNVKFIAQSDSVKSLKDKEYVCKIDTKDGCNKILSLKAK